MISKINLTIGILSLIIQFSAVYFAYKIYLFNRLGKGWISIIVAFIIMGLRRVTALLIELGFMPAYSGAIKTLDTLWLPFIITILIAIGIYSMLGNFENFEVVEKNLRNKLKKFK